MASGSGPRPRPPRLAGGAWPISTEALATFIRFWLTTTSALPEPAARAARAMVAERYSAYTKALGRRLAKGPHLRQEISEDLAGGGRMETAGVDH